MRSVTGVASDITIVAVDDATQDRYGTYPVSRQAFVDLLSALQRTHPRVVAFDLGLYESGPDPAIDAALSAAIGGAGNVVLAAQGTGRGERDASGLRFSGSEVPIPSFADQAADLGSITVTAQAPVLRDLPAVVTGPAGDRYYNLAIVAAAHHLGATSRDLRLDRNGLILMTGGRSQLISPDGALRFLFAAPPQAVDGIRAETTNCQNQKGFPVISLVDVVDGRVPATCLSGRTVWVGVHSARGINDTFVTPTGGKPMWGVELLANAEWSILNDKYPAQDQGLTVTVAELAAFTAFGIVLVARSRSIGLAVSVACLGAFVGIALAAFHLRANWAGGTGTNPVPSVAYLIPAVLGWLIALGYLRNRDP